MKLILTADDLYMFKWWVYESYAIHDNCKGLTGAVITIGKVAVTRLSIKQKIQGKSSTEDDIIGMDNAFPQALCTKYFLDTQWYTVEENIMYQENKSAILLETHRKMSSSNHTKQIKVRLFFIKDVIVSGYLSVDYLLTEKMWVDVLIKTLQGNELK